MAMAARNPAPPPPTMSTSWAARMRPSATPKLLVDEHLSAVVDDHAMDAAIVELFFGALAPAGVAHLLGDQPLLVLHHDAFAVTRSAARRRNRLERTDR